MKKGLLALGVAVAMAFSGVALADQPLAMLIHNNTASSGTASVSGIQSPHVIMAGGTQLVPWSLVSMMCSSFVDSLCEINVYTHADQKPLHAADVLLDVDTGDMTVAWVHKAYTVTVNGPGEVTITGGPFSTPKV